MLEDFLNALQNFKRNRMRTFLSLLGVIIGVTSVIVITSMGRSSTEKVKETFGSSGLDMVSVNPGFMRRRRDAVQIQFNESFRARLFGDIGGIKKIWFKNSMNATISYGETSVNCECSAIETGYLESYGIERESGRMLNVSENQEGLQRTVLGSQIASLLFPAGDGVGKTVLVTSDGISFAFEVVGVLKEQNSGIEPSTSVAYIPRGFYAKKIVPNPEASVIMVQAVSAERATALADSIQSYCTELTGTEYSVNVMSMQTIIEQVDSITTTMSIMLSAIAAISLLVGGIGIMNIMIVTVTERRQEIGIRKALGARPSDIRRQFLVESAAITLIGGTAGIACGIIVSIAVEFVRSLSYIISWKACAVAFVFSVFVGIFFGLNPAARAAKLDPVLALSGE
ncbi:MAG: ABC transporter permease [Treponema sp.]|nr:ABC transporter permease [Treponema sp.]